MTRGPAAILYLYRYVYIYIISIHINIIHINYCSCTYLLLLLLYIYLGVHMYIIYYNIMHYIICIYYIGSARRDTIDRSSLGDFNRSETSARWLKRGRWRTI